MRDEYLILLFSLSLLLFISVHVIGACCLSGNSPSGALDFKAVLNFFFFFNISQITMAQDDFVFTVVAVLLIH